jgi:hypothetical protein
MGIRKSVLLVIITALVTFAVLYPVSNSLWLNYPGEGLHQVRLVKRCTVVFYDKPWQPFRTLTFDCPGKDSVRIWPLPVVDPWNEDWWESQMGKEKV